VQRCSVQKCDEDGKGMGAPLEIYAASEIKAAEIATGMKLRPRASREKCAPASISLGKLPHLPRSLPRHHLAKVETTVR
jgi:hypothetical protein